MEKVALGREHKVAKWFQDGLTEIVSEHPIRPLVELKSQLGAEMACTLLWIQNQTLHTKPREQGLVLTGVIVEMIGCYSCQAAIFTGDRNCHSCSRSIAVDDWNALYSAIGLDIMWTEPSTVFTGLAAMPLLINLQHLMCRQCSKCAFSLQVYACPSCGQKMSYDHVRLRPIHNEGGSGGASQRILEEFRDEIDRYESWD